MTHFDSDILELYVLKSPRVDPLRLEIEAHLEACLGCRDLVQNIRETYELARQSLAGIEEVRARASVSLRKRSDELIPLFSPIQGRVDRPLKQHLIRTANFVRGHPLMGGFALLGLFGGLILTLSLWIPLRDHNPAYVHLNRAQGYFEVYNLANRKLWSLPGSLPPSEAMTQACEIVDLVGDGKNNVVTTIPLDGLDLNNQPSFKILGEDGKLVYRYRADGPSHYRGVNYASDRVVPEPFCSTAMKGGHREFVVNFSGGRSPSGLIRLDEHAQLIGEYWHFGNLPVMLNVALGEGRPGLLLGGFNDCGDSSGDGFPVAIVLDWQAISGITEATATQGFGMQASNAELAYVQIPLSDMDKALHTKPGIVKGHISHVGDREVWVLVVAANSSGEPPSFEFYFDREMNLFEVKTNDSTVKLHKDLEARGILRGALDRIYLKTLGRKIRYWNGNVWSAMHSPLAYPH